MDSSSDHGSSEYDSDYYQSSTSSPLPWHMHKKTCASLRVRNYDEPQPYFSSIVESLKSVKRPGSYATGGEFPMPMPAISLNSAPDVILGLPLSESQVRQECACIFVCMLR